MVLVSFTRLGVNNTSVTYIFMKEQPGLSMEETNRNSELAFSDEAYPKTKIYDHVMRVLGRNLDDLPRGHEDRVFRVPKVLRLPVLYDGSEEETLNDHYACTYWMTALWKLRMLKVERNAPVDLSTSNQDTEYDPRMRLSAIDSSGCPSSPVEPNNHSCNLRLHRKRKNVSGTPPRVTNKCISDDVRRSSPKPRLKLCRYFSTKFRSRSARKTGQLQENSDGRSCGSDPDSGTNPPAAKKVVDRNKIDRLVSEGTMLNAVHHIPYELLDLHPVSSKLPYMELSLKGIGDALHQISQLMNFYRKVARDMCLDVVHPRSAPRVSESLANDVIIFLIEMKRFFESLFPAAFTFLVSEGVDLRKLKLWVFYKDSFAKHWQGLNLSLYLILFDRDSLAERRKAELWSYYKAICSLKS